MRLKKLTASLTTLIKGGRKGGDINGNPPKNLQLRPTAFAGHYLKITEHPKNLRFGQIETT